jgi:hypothetical protein
MVSGDDRSINQASGARMTSKQRPIVAHATRHPLAVTSAPTAGNASMNPTLIAKA